MSHIEKSVYVDKALSFAQGLAFRYRHEFITPEHILSALFNQDPFVEAVEECFCHIPVMEEEVDEYLAQKMEQVPEDTNYELQFSVQSNLLFQNAYAFVESSNAEVLDIPHVVQAMLLLPDGHSSRSTGHVAAAGILGLLFSEKTPEGTDSGFHQPTGGHLWRRPQPG